MEAKIPAEGDKLKEFIETIFRLNRERGWGSRKIAKYVGGVSHMFVYRILQFGSPEKAYEYYKGKVRKVPKKKREKFEEVLAENIQKLDEAEAKELEKELEKVEKSYEEKLIKAGTRRILTELTKRASSLSLQHLKRIIEQGLLVDEIFEDVLREREEILKRIAVEERLKRELLNEGLIYLLAGKIDREKFAKLLLATELM
ncbi:hypothetical protein DRO54_10335 [Candidatus Bathyarchaeota archaeon]|nr:MAG: hypothetical protein DRO54_10335 [Candidatus Bathyarchaeota archaeon]